MLKKSFVVFFGVVLLFSVIQNTYAESEIKSPIFIQIKLYNSDGQLVGYNEGYPQIFHLNEAINWLESRSQKNTIVIDEKSFEILQFKDRMSWSESQSHGQYYLRLPINGNLQYAVFFHQDSFHVKDGDYAEIFWTVFRPLN